MTSFLTIALFVTSAFNIWLFRREIMTIGQAIAAGILEFRARLKEIDDELWRR